MLVSEARIQANRQNAARSTGPKTAEGKAISRQNGVKHGLTGEGIVVPEGDAEEIARRAEALTADMKPMTPAGVILIAQMAMLSVRAERAAEQEIAATASRVRNAADTFDEERIEAANRLFASLGEDPRNALRRLRKSPEGVDRLHDAWLDLRNDLAIEPEPLWTAEHLERAAHLTGLKARHARGSRFGALSRALEGDFGGLTDEDGGDLDVEGRKAWAKLALRERIDAELAALEAHFETLDFEMIAIDRAEAGARALFDPSKASTLARRYEAEARRGFYKALKEFRQVEVESIARGDAVPAASPASQVASPRETPPPPAREPVQPYPASSWYPVPLLVDRDGQPLPAIPTVPPPG